MMKFLQFSYGGHAGRGMLFIIIATLLFISAPHLFGGTTAGYVDMGIWHVVLLAIITWGLLIALSITLFNSLLRALAFPQVGTMVLQFKELDIWQRYLVYAFLYCLLLLSGVGCLAAIC